MLNGWQRKPSVRTSYPLSIGRSILRTIANIVLCSRLADGRPFFGQLTYRFRLSRIRVCVGREWAANENNDGSHFPEFWSTEV